MSKVTSKLQVTLPKALAKQYKIEPGDDILWVASGDVIRVVPSRGVDAEPDVTARLRLFDAATARQRAREHGHGAARPPKSRGWTREGLYRRGRAR